MVSLNLKGLSCIQDTFDVFHHSQSSYLAYLSIIISNAVSHFLLREFNKGFAEVTGPKVNRGAGFGLEVLV